VNCLKYCNYRQRLLRAFRQTTPEWKLHT
jgi:hypothetical protein